MAQVERRIYPWKDTLGQCSQHIAEDAKAEMAVLRLCREQKIDPFVLNIKALVT